MSKKCPEEKGIIPEVFQRYVTREDAMTVYAMLRTQLDAPRIRAEAEALSDRELEIRLKEMNDQVFGSDACVRYHVFGGTDVG